MDGPIDPINAGEIMGGSGSCTGTCDGSSPAPPLPLFLDGRCVGRRVMDGLVLKGTRLDNGGVLGLDGGVGNTPTNVSSPANGKSSVCARVFIITGTDNNGGGGRGIRLRLY